MGCTEENVVTQNDVTHFVHTGCEDASRIEHYKFEHLGHSWPGEIYGTSTHRVIWDFFSRFPEA